MALFDGKSGDTSAPLSIDQIHIILQACQKRKPLKAMILLPLYSGISMPEALALQKKHIDFSSAKLSLSIPKRELAFSPIVMDALSEAIEVNADLQSDKVFPYSEATVKKTLNDLGLSSLGFTISWSTLRKSWAVLCFKHGVRIESMVIYSSSSVEALAKWAVFGKPGLDLPFDILNYKAVEYPLAQL